MPLKFNCTNFCALLWRSAILLKQWSNLEADLAKHLCTYLIRCICRDSLLNGAAFVCIVSAELYPIGFYCQESWGGGRLWNTLNGKGKCDLKHAWLLVNWMEILNCWSIIDIAMELQILRVTDVVIMNITTCLSWVGVLHGCFCVVDESVPHIWEGR